MTGTILDISMSASSVYDDYSTGPGRARVNQSESMLFLSHSNDLNNNNTEMSNFKTPCCKIQ